jgi:hypothetical protein
LESTEFLIIVASDTEIPLKENTDMAGHRTAQLKVSHCMLSLNELQVLE